jgi:hypothetical protein
MATSLLGSAGGVTSIGRYFTVVSALPSAAFTSYVYLLFKTGAWSGDVNWTAAVTQFDIGSAAFLVVASFVIALALHPLQFTLTQLLEGYWGLGPGFRQVALLRILHHRRRYQFLKDRGTYAASVLDKLGTRQKPNHPDAAIQAVAAALLNSESRRLRVSYPEQLQDIRPTRLGNVLRRYEIAVGSTYGLDAVSTAPRAAVVARSPEVDYLQSQRMQMDLAVRTSVLAMMAALITVVVMWRHNVWLLVALIPYTISYGSYRGAVTVAHEYGTALSVLIELTRFNLYERLRLPLPKTLDEERDTNESLMRAFRLQKVGWLDYADTKATSDGEAPPEP